jgi:hypothetical protein
MHTNLCSQNFRQQFRSPRLSTSVSTRNGHKHTVTTIAEIMVQIRAQIVVELLIIGVCTKLDRSIVILTKKNDQQQHAH